MRVPGEPYTLPICMYLCDEGCVHSYFLMGEMPSRKAQRVQCRELHGGHMSSMVVT